ncbi:MAG: hypothetical protein IT353_18895 [Gemmatimonadaceae bacterium]|nr:hypothetical protein [Gemmatimonadaceae bacterium]
MAAAPSRPYHSVLNATFRLDCHESHDDSPRLVVGRWRGKALTMDQATHNKIVSFIRGTADHLLRELRQSALAS